MRFFVDARYIRTDFHDGISRFTAQLGSALYGLAPDEVTFLIHDRRQLEHLPQGAPWLLFHSNESMLEPIAARKLNKYRPDVLFSPLQTIGTTGRNFKVILTLHDLIYYRHRKPPSKLNPLVKLGWRAYHLTYWPQRIALNGADAVATVSSDGGSYKPLNWMSPPCIFAELEPDEGQADAGIQQIWEVTHKKTGDKLRVQIFEIVSDSQHHLGVDPGLTKDGVEAHLQELLAAQIERLGDGHQLVRREYMTAIGPVDILARDASGKAVAVEIKRRGEIDGVEQLTRYLKLMNRDPLLAPVEGVFAAQEIKPQARTLAEDRGIRCLVLDYDEMRGSDSGAPRLF